MCSIQFYANSFFIHFRYNFMYFTQKDFFLTSKMVYYRYDIVQ